MTMPNNTADREGFEAWASDKYGEDRLQTFSDGDYCNDDIDTDWRVWQAAQAQSAERVRVLERALRKAIDDYGKPGGPWNVPSEPGTWIELAKTALGEKV